MRERELRKYARCCACHNLIGATGLPLFWRVSIERFGVDAGAIRRQSGLTALLGGSAELAIAMGADEEMARPMMEKLTLSIGEACALERWPVAALAELTGVES